MLEPFFSLPDRIMQPYFHKMVKQNDAKSQEYHKGRRQGRVELNEYLKAKGGAACEPKP